MKSKDELNEFFGVKTKAFSPVAYYDKFMDTIRVEFRDCSAHEKRISENLTVIVDNHPESSQAAFAGFVIKGIGHLFECLEIPKEGVLMVVDLINRMLEKGILEENDKQEIAPLVQTAQTLEMAVEFDVAA